MGYNEEHNVFEVGLTCAEWIDTVAQGVGWDAFRKQERFLHMAGDIDKDPVTKPNCVDELRGIVEGRIGWLIDLLVANEIGDIHKCAGVQLDEETAEWYNWQMGKEEGDEGYVRPFQEKEE